MGSNQDAMALATRDHAEIVRAEDFMPLMSVKQAVERKGMINQFIGQVLNEDLDYGKIAGGVQQKKVLLKPGAEKLCSIFGLAPKYVKEVIVEDWTGEDHGHEPLFSYEYRCQLWRGDRFMGEAIGSCNSWESKYRYRWVTEDVAKQRADFADLPKRGGQTWKFEPMFALDKRETEGQYGKPNEYWDSFQEAIQNKTARYVEKKKLGTRTFDGWEMQINTMQYRVPNPDVADIINTCQKMAQKRALVAAVLVVTNCSDAFTQDIEDFAPAEEHVQSEPKPEPKQAPKTQPKQRPVPKELTVVFTNLDKDIRSAGEAYSRIEGLFIRKAGDAGVAKYNEIADLFNKQYPQGTSDKGAHKDFLLDLWDALQAVEPEAPPQADVAMEAK